MHRSMPARSKKPAKKPEGRKKSKLTQAGEEGARAAKRALLKKTLEALDWNLSATAEELEMGDASAVIRAIRDCGLEEAYEAAKERGDIARGKRS